MADQQSEANKHEGIEERLHEVLLRVVAQRMYGDEYERSVVGEAVLDALIAHLSASPDDLAALVVACGWEQVGWTAGRSSYLPAAYAPPQASDRGEGEN